MSPNDFGLPTAEELRLQGRVSRMEAALTVVVTEMERYYRDGRHPDLRPMYRQAKAALREAEERSA